MNQRIQLIVYHLAGELEQITPVRIIRMKGNLDTKQPTVTERNRRKFYMI